MVYKGSLFYKWFIKFVLEEIFDWWKRIKIVRGNSNYIKS